MYWVLVLVRLQVRESVAVAVDSKLWLVGSISWEAEGYKRITEYCHSF